MRKINFFKVESRINTKNIVFFTIILILFVDIYFGVNQFYKLNKAKEKKSLLNKKLTKEMESINNYDEEEYEEFKVIIKENELIINGIRAENINHTTIVKEVIGKIPEEVFLTKLSVLDRKVNLIGESKSKNNIIELYNNIKIMDKYSRGEISQIKEIKDKYIFQLEFEVR